MVNKKRNIIIWALTWAVLFLVVAYSPIGRPDLYVGTSYYTYNQGVNFKSGIANAPSGKALATNDNADAEISTYAPIDDSNGASSGNASKFTPQNVTSSTETKSSSTSQSGNSSNSLAMGFASSRQQAQGTATAQDNNVSSLTANYSNASLTGERRQTKAVTGGGVDWGGDPTGSPIPVGDGWWLLLAMAGTYAIWKQHRSVKPKSTPQK